MANMYIPKIDVGGDTYIVKDSGIRKMVQEIQSDIEHDQNIVYNLGPFIENEVVRTDGTFVSKNGYSRTGYIPIIKGINGIRFVYESTDSTGDSDSYGIFFNENHNAVVPYPFSPNHINFSLYRNKILHVPEDAAYFVVNKKTGYDLGAFGISDNNLRTNGLSISQVAQANWVALDLSVMDTCTAWTSSAERASNSTFHSTDYILIGENDGYIYAENDAPDDYDYHRNSWFFDEWKNPISRFSSHNVFTKIPSGATYIACSIGMEYKIRVYKVLDVNNKTTAHPGAGLFFKDQINDYWTSAEGGYYLNSRIGKILERNANTRLVIFTDVHYPSNRKQSELIVPYVADAINASNVIFGGDAIDSAETTALGESMHKPFCLKMQDTFPYNFRTVMGNHDRNSVDSDRWPDLDSRYVSYEFLYNNYIRKWEKGIQYEYRQTNALSEYNYWNKMHYYWDDYTNKIRYIVVYTGNTSEPDDLKEQFYPDDPDKRVAGMAEIYYQLEFVYNAIKTLSDGWGVFVMGHALCPNNGDVNNGPHPAAACLFRLLNGIKSRSSDTILGGNARFYTPNFASARFDCSDMPKIDLIGVWGGHFHIDCCGVYTGHDYSNASWTPNATDGSVADSLVYIGTGCDSITRRVNGSTPMESETVSEQLIDVISIDRASRSIYVDRIGAGSNTVPLRTFKY